MIERIIDEMTVRMITEIAEVAKIGIIALEKMISARADMIEEGLQGETDLKNTKPE